MDPFLVATAATTIAAGCAAWWWRRQARLADVDTTDLRQQLLAERHAAHYDPLTGLLNRRTFYHLGSALLADPACKPMVAVVVNLDSFRKLNESHGHLIGDQLLNTLARRFADYTTGNLVGRLDGDEFVALLTSSATPGGSSYPDARALARIMATPIWASGHYVSVTATVGMADVNGSTDLDEVLRRADAVLRRAKAVRQQPTAPMPMPPTGGDLAPSGPVYRTTGPGYRNTQLLLQRRRRRIRRQFTVRFRR